MRKALTVALLLAAIAPTPALATGEIESLITQADRARLEKFDAARKEAMAEARKEGAPQDVKLLDEIDARPKLSFSGFDMTGDWQCRTIKAGGPAPLVVYGWFKCRVTDDGSGWRLDKLSGSQRTTGRFFDETEASLTYLGVLYIAGDAKPAYGASPDSDQVGRAFRSGKDRWRIEFPLPRYESKFDILEFRR
ncbi:MAG: DUF4893 domain-containing protein [Rhizobiales bacterium]|mgnify:CR=1 FL=1|nr:DUF4893 domain-containing protein [Hyphomicrobiales bacterium]